MVHMGPDMDNALSVLDNRCRVMPGRNLPAGSFTSAFPSSYPAGRCAAGGAEEGPRGRPGPRAGGVAVVCITLSVVLCLQLHPPSLSVRPLTAVPRLHVHVRRNVNPVGRMALSWTAVHTCFCIPLPAYSTSPPPRSPPPYQAAVVRDAAKDYVKATALPKVCV